MWIGIREATEDAEAPDTSNSRKPLSPVITGRTQCYKSPLEVRASTEGPLGKSYYSRGHATVNSVTQRTEGEKKKYLDSFFLHPLTFCRKLKLVRSNQNYQGNPSDVIQKSQLPEAESWVEKGREWI